jgi:hypothetical protein
LFRAPEGVFARRYGVTRREKADPAFPGAQIYARQVLKIPVWAMAEDERVMRAYVDGFRKIADHVRKWGTL